MRVYPTFNAEDAPGFIQTEPLFTELVGVSRSDKSEYEADNWRVLQVGTWGKFALMPIGYEVYQAQVWHAILPNGTRPESVGAKYHTGVGEVKIEDDIITLKSLNTVWKFRVLDASERVAYALARALFEATRENEAQKIIEEMMAPTDVERNAFDFVETPEDIYRLADVIIDNFYGLPTPALALEREFIVAAISLHFEIHDLFAHPGRKSYCHYRRETHFRGLTKPLNMKLEAYDLMIEKCVAEGLDYDKEEKEWVPAPDRRPQPNSITVTHWRRTKDYPEPVREEAYKHVGAVVENVCDNYYRQLLKELDLI